MIASNQKDDSSSNKTLKSPQDTTRFATSIQPMVAGDCQRWPSLLLLTIAAGGTVDSDGGA